MKIEKCTHNCSINRCFISSQTCIKRSHLGQRSDLYKTIDVKFSTTGQNKGDLLIQVTS